MKTARLADLLELARLIHEKSANRYARVRASVEETERKIRDVRKAMRCIEGAGPELPTSIRSANERRLSEELRRQLTELAKGKVELEVAREKLAIALGRTEAVKKIRSSLEREVAQKRARSHLLSHQIDNQNVPHHRA